MPANTVPVAPSRIAVGPQGELYFGDREANMVVRLNANGTLTVVAGNGVAGFSGDGGPATQASLNQPSGFAVDSLGNLFISDIGNVRVRKVDLQGIITTVAGNGKFGFSGDGGPAILAALSFANGGTSTSDGATPVQNGGPIAVDGLGNLYIADTANGRVRKVGKDGTMSTQASVPSPNAIAADALGNLYIAGANSGIQEVTSGGVLSTLKFTGTALALTADTAGNLYAVTLTGVVMISATGNVKNLIGSSSLVGSSIAVDQQGNVFLSSGSEIDKVDAQGNMTRVVGTGLPNFFGDGGEAVNAGLSAPNSIAVDATGSVYIADTNNRRVRMVDSHGNISTVAAFAANSGTVPYHIALTPDGSLLVTGSSTSPLLKITKSGSMSTFTNLVGALDLTVDGAGNVYVLDNKLILQKVDPTGTTITQPAGGIKSLCTPFLHQCLATDAAGNVYMANGGSVAKVTPSGTVTNIPVLNVSAISGIAVDSAANIYVSDTGAHSRVLRVSPDGTTTPFAGNNAVTFGGDGGPALQASLFNPVGLSLDSRGILYIADNGNARVREVFTQATPLITSVGMASGSTDVAQNGWIEIKGGNLASSTTNWNNAPDFAAGKLPTQLGGVSVTVNGKPAFVYYVSPSQINVLTPLDSTTGSVAVVVTTSETSTAPFLVNLQSVAPTFALSGATRYIAARHADGSLVGPAQLSTPGFVFSPAKPGETIMLYGFGFGLPTAALENGSSSQSGNLPVLPVIQVSGVQAMVGFAGVVMPGLYQFNVTVPSTVEDGDDLVTCSFSGSATLAGALIAVAR
jgi:uncharacterized protein (TIGR03437 family)